ncbi:MAG: ABC transporter ATP-binding protein [Phycisphaerales bacterium]
MISLHSVSKSFGRVHAVADASFEVPRGRVVGLLGSNGAGKTTTLRMIAGFLPPDAGTITIDGMDSVAQSLDARRRVGYLPEASPAYGEMLVRDYLRFRGKLFGLRGTALSSAASLAIDRCDLVEVASRRIGTLSRGFRQRVGLAAAILHDPPVLVLDEPTSALDPKQVRQARVLIRDLARDKAVLISSHVLGEVEQSCDEVVIMARGRVCASGTPAELTRKLSTSYVIEARADVARVKQALSGIRSAGTIETAVLPEGWSSARLSPSHDAPDLREAIALAAAQANLPVRELRRESPGLERVFLALTETTPGPDA